MKSYLARSVAIYANGTASIVYVNTLREWQDIVGGYVQAVPLRASNGVTMSILLNEDGVSKGLPPNEAATAVCKDCNVHLDFNSPSSVLLGNVLIIGPAGPNGEAKDVPFDEVVRILGYFDDFIISKR